MRFGSVFVVAGIYSAWFVLVVRKAAKRPRLFGPQWLAIAATSVLYRFGCWYLKFSADTEEAIRNGKFDPKKQYMLVFHPHGAFGCTALLFYGYFVSTSTGFPREQQYCVVADVLLKIPLLAELLLLVNARSADSKTMSRILENGFVMGIQPGGVYEQVRTDENKETVYFPARLGFIRHAVQHGVPLLPVYAFGENQIFPTTKWLRSFNIWLYNSFRLPNLFVHGFLGLPVTPMIPSPLILSKVGRPLHLKWGKPVEVGARDAQPSDEKILEVYERYCASLTELFDQHKDTCLPGPVAARGLTIILREGRRDKDKKAD